MKQITIPFFALMMMLTMVGCGGSSMELPESAITKDCFAVEWYDTKSMSPDGILKLMNGVADDMSNDQPKARMWMSAQADGMESSYQDRWEEFTQAGGEGFLVLHYAMEVTTGEGDNATTSTEYKRFVLVRVKKDTSTDDLEKAVEEFAEDDGNAKIKFKKVDGEDRWFYLTREGEGTPDLPEDGDKDTLKAFKKLLKQGSGASAVMVWRMPDSIKEDIEKALKVEGITDEQKDRLKEQLHTESVVMVVQAGSSPKVTVTVLFDESEYADTYAEEHNDGLIATRAAMKDALSNTENPPHPSVVNDIVDEMELKPSGKKVSITMGRRQVEDGLGIMAAIQRGGVDTASPGGLVDLNSRLRVPRVSGVIGIHRINFND